MQVITHRTHHYGTEPGQIGRRLHVVPYQVAHGIYLNEVTVRCLTLETENEYTAHTQDDDQIQGQHRDKHPVGVLSESVHAESETKGTNADTDESPEAAHSGDAAQRALDNGTIIDHIKYLEVTLNE